MYSTLDIFDTAIGYNVATLEGAIQYVLSICGCLSAESIDRFARIYAQQRNKTLKSKNDVSVWLLQQMRRRRVIFQIGNSRYYTVSPMIKPDRSMQDAFWMYLEYFNRGETLLQTLSAGPVPAQLTFSRQERDYHIIAVKENGERELKQAIMYENQINSLKRDYKTKDGELHKNKYLEERFIILFRQPEFMKNAAYNLQNKTMYGLVSYPESDSIPRIRLYSPDKLDNV